MGSHAELMKQKGLYFALVTMQVCGGNISCMYMHIKELCICAFCSFMSLPLPIMSSIANCFSHLTWRVSSVAVGRILILALSTIAFSLRMRWQKQRRETLMQQVSHVPFPVSSSAGLGYSRNV